MNWNQIDNEKTIDIIIEASKEKPVLIFKHSTRCSISSMALNRLTSSWNEEEMAALSPYFLDLISYRGISQKIAEVFNTPHQSPQILLIKDGKSIYDSSHMGISYNDLKSQLTTK